jgi:hypothetical protein
VAAVALVHGIAGRELRKAYIEKDECDELTCHRISVGGDTIQYLLSCSISWGLAIILFSLGEPQYMGEMYTAAVTNTAKETKNKKAPKPAER